MPTLPTTAPTAPPPPSPAPLVYTCGICGELHAVGSPRPCVPVDQGSVCDHCGMEHETRRCPFTKPRGGKQA